MNSHMTSLPMDLANWAHVPRRGPRHQQLLDLAQGSPGRIFAAVDAAEGLHDYVERLTSLPPMPVEDLLPQMSAPPPATRWLHYFKHWVLRSQVKDGVLRASRIKIALHGNPWRDAAEKQVLLADIPPSMDWTARKEAA